MINYFKQFFKLVIAFNILLVAIAYLIEYSLDLNLCQLCHYQRYVYIIAIIIAIIGLLAQFTRKIAGILIVVMYLGNAVMAMTQVLMEEGYIAPSAACTGLIPSGVDDLESFKAKILSNDYVPCNIGEVRFLRISLAGFSFIASAAMFFFCGIFLSVLLFFRYHSEESISKYR